MLSISSKINDGSDDDDDDEISGTFPVKSVVSVMHCDVLCLYCT